MKKRRTVNQGAMDKLWETMKDETRLLGAVQRYLLGRGDDGSRDMSKLHVSEVCKADWCPRQSYYRLAGYPAASGRDYSFTLENIFEEGAEIHRKWQRRWQEMGVLRGVWRCRSCRNTFEATSPKVCPLCDSEILEYREVPLSSPEHLLIGHADGDIHDNDGPVEDQPLVEVKSVGKGTLRFETPHLLAKHSHKVTDAEGHEHSWTDMDALWRDIKRPFSTHLRQGKLYCYLSGRKTMVFIYECKWNQQVKEFVVRYRPGSVDDILDRCLDVKYALSVRKPPRRPHWADPDVAVCKSCPFKDECYSNGEVNGKIDQSAVSGQGKNRKIVRGARAPEGAGAPPLRRARRRHAVASRQPD